MLGPTIRVVSDFWWVGMKTDTGELPGSRWLYVVQETVFLRQYLTPNGDGTQFSPDLFLFQFELTFEVPPYWLYWAGEGGAVRVSYTSHRLMTHNSLTYKSSRREPQSLVLCKRNSGTWDSESYSYVSRVRFTGFTDRGRVTDRSSSWPEREHGGRVDDPTLCVRRSTVSRRVDLRGPKDPEFLYLTNLLKLSEDYSLKCCLNQGDFTRLGKFFIRRNNIKEISRFLTLTLTHTAECGH